MRARLVCARGVRSDMWWCKVFPSTVKIILVMRLARTRAQRIVSAYAQLFVVFQVDVLSRCSAPLGHAEAGSVQEIVGRRGPIAKVRYDEVPRWYFTSPDPSTSSGL